MSMISRLASAAFLATMTAGMFGQNITPPPGNTVFLTAHATGTQNYICMPATHPGKTSSPTWKFLGPQATLSKSAGTAVQQVTTHFLSAVPAGDVATKPGCALSGDEKQLYCPTWQSSLDTSAVWGTKTGSINAGSDPSCPNAGAVPCLLLKAIATRPGGLLARTTYIKRVKTTGGNPPVSSCRVGALALVPYSADYSFYSK